MSLDFNLENMSPEMKSKHRIKNEEGYYENSNALNCLLWNMMSIGVDRISSNRRKLINTLNRLRMYENTFGAFRYTKNEDGSTTDHPWTMDELEEFVGLSTNVSTLTDAQFGKQIVRRLESDATYELNKERQEKEKAA